MGGAEECETVRERELGLVCKLKFLEIIYIYVCVCHKNTSGIIRTDAMNQEV